MILLLNSAVMPDEGVYTLKQISVDTFKKVLRETSATDNFKSYIGYPETARLIEQITGIAVGVSREQATLTSADTMLIVRLRHRVANSADKEILQPTVDDFDFFQCGWKPLD